MLLELSPEYKQNFRRLEINEPYTDQVLKRVLKKGMTVIECGASQGYFTILISSLVGKGGKCICFEPFPKYYHLINENIKLNNIQNVQVIQTGVDKKSGSIKFPVNTETSYAGIQELWDFQSTKKVEVVTSEEKLVEIPTIVLSDFIKKENLKVDMLFTDVEGCEKMIFEDIFENCSREELPEYVFFESHPGFYGKEVQQQICENFIDHDYKVEKITNIHFLMTKS